MSETFSTQVRRQKRRERARKVLRTGFDIVTSALGGPASVAMKSLGGSASSNSLQNMWEMQEKSREVQAEYLELQQKMQADNRQFQMLSNIMKARHDTVRAAIANMRV